MLSNNETMNESTELKIGSDARMENIKARLSISSSNETMNEGTEPKHGSEAWLQKQQAEIDEATWRKLVSTKVPPRYQAAETDNSVALDWIRDPKGVLYIYGPTGTGKTHMSWALVREHLRILDPWAFMGGSVASFLDQMKPGRIPNDKLGTQLDPQVKAIQTRLLLLDDIGSTRLTDWTLETLFNILDSRYNRLLPTIISSNLMPGDDLVDLVGDRIASRMAEDATLISVVGEDRRRP